MTKSKTTSADAGNKTPLKETVVGIIDKAAFVFAGLFFIATSYGYVSAWLEAHQGKTDFSVAGGIMVVAIALYLFVRNKR